MRYQNLGFFASFVIYVLIGYLTWLFKGRHKVPTHHLKRMIVSYFTAGVLIAWLPVFYLMFTGFNYRAARDYFNGLVGST